VISARYLEALFALLPDPVLSVDEQGRVLSLSSAAERVLGHDPEALGADVLQLVAPDDVEAFRELLRTSGLPARGEIGFRRKDGEHRIGSIVVIPVEADDPVRVLFIRDLTEERRARTELEVQATELELQAEELQARAAQFRDAQRELESTNEQLLRANEELAARTADADRARQIAEETRCEAEAANRAKSEFLATMSHEIRTPINAIIGYTDLLDMGIGGHVTEDQKKKLHRIKSSSQHLLALVDDVLDLAKVEAGRMTVEPGRAAAGDAVAAALALVRPLAAQRGIDIVEEGSEELPPEERPTYVGDEDRVRQVLVNLLSNAIKFSEEGGSIFISYDTVRDPETEDVRWTCVGVTDTGIGVAPEALERIFYAFEQVEHGHTRTRGGTGLGLTISRRLARLMGGDLTVKSEPGRGSTFTLWLPSEPTILGPIDETLLAEMLGSGALPRGLAAAGIALQENARSLLDAQAHRIRHDPRIPMARGLGDADVEDHALSFLADLGNTMIALEKARVTPERLLRDGGEIQRIVAELHGSQRAQLGWSEDAIMRELEIQHEEVRDTIIRCAPHGTDVDGVLRVLGRFLERAERITLISWRRASAVPGTDLPSSARSGSAAPHRTGASTPPGSPGTRDAPGAGPS